MPRDHVDGMTLWSNLLTEGHTDPMREMLRVMLQQVMTAEVGQHCNADYNERSVERANSRV